MSKILKTVIAAAAIIAAPASALAGKRDTPEQELAKMLEGRVQGKPVNCIPLSNTRESTIIDGKAIVYRVGGKLYVNDLKGNAGRLDDDDILVTRTFSSQLCRNDVVTLIDRGSQIQHGFVILGNFVPYAREKVASR